MNVAIARRLTGTLVVSMIAVLASAQTITAGQPDGIDWKRAVNVRNADGVQLHDAALVKELVAVVLEEPGTGAPSVSIHTSDVAGKSFVRPVMVPAARQPAVDVCHGVAEAVYAKKRAAGDWVIKHASGPIGGLGDFSFRTVAAGPGISRFPDVACTEGRTFASWYHREDDGDLLLVAHNKFQGDFGTPIDLGLDDRTAFGSRSLAIAGVDDSAYAVFQRSDGKLRFASWSIGDQPAYHVTENPLQVIAPGTPNDSANGAVIAAEGDKVAVAWFRCDAVLARVSNDRGETWGPISTLVSHAACGGDFGAFQNSIAIHDGRIVVSYGAVGLFTGFVGLVSTTNDFATFTDDIIAERYHTEHIVGFVRLAGETKLGAAFDTGDRVRFRRER